MYKIGLEIQDDWPAFLDGAAAFITSNTSLIAPPAVPELKLHLATAFDPIWRMTEEMFASKNIPAPFWCVAWPGGQALARYLLDHPHMVAGKRVFDFASGSGLVALAAKRAGATHVIANDIDPVSMAAITLNAKANDLELIIEHKNRLNAPVEDADIILAGDFCYEWPMAGYAVEWMRGLVQAGKTVLFADPGRLYAPKEGIEELFSITIPTSRDVEDNDHKTVRVFRLLAAEEE